MDTCGICHKPADQLFETIKEGVNACFKCQPLVPEITIDDNVSDSSQAQESADSPYYCGLCHKTFQKNQQLQNHIRNHRAERRFVCTYCSKAFSQSNNLRAHLRIHTNERPFKCNDCGKAFTQVTNLNNHVRLHTGERPFVCEEPGCDKAFAQVTNLNQHRKRHLSGRADHSYECSVCGEQFSQRNHMTNHRRTVHGEVKSPVRPTIRRSCAICELTFPNERLLQMHAAQHAPGEVEIVDTESKYPEGSCAICELTFPNERLLQMHAAQHAPGEVEIVDTETPAVGCNTTVSAAESEFACVFSTCGVRLASAAEHTDHLLRAHQLRVLASGAARPPRRGRPPKNTQAAMQDPLEIAETDYTEVKILKTSQYLPKLKVQSLFQ